jgi:hypothetical protein
VWQRASAAVRTSWIVLIVGFVMLLYGWRWVRYSSAGVALTCHSLACDITIYPIGFHRSIKISNIHRQQLSNVMGIKTKRDGTFVTDQNVVLMEPYTTKKKGKSKSSSYAKSSAYKGPDENGHYLTYAILLRDRDTSKPDIVVNGEEETETVPEVDLTPLLPYLDAIESTSDSAKMEPHPPQYRLIPRKFGTRHSQRRVRTMVQKIESYMKHRRQKLVVIENAAPAWQGIVLIVVGAMVVLITCAVGQFYDEVAHRGPGVRRKEQLKKHNPSPSTIIAKRKMVVQNVNQLATPLQYEVRTAPNVAVSATKTNKVSTTSSSSSSNNPNVNYRRAAASAHARSRVTH